MFVGLVTHNAYVGVAAEHGLVGGALFMMIFGYALYIARQSSLRGRGTARSDLEVVARTGSKRVIKARLAELPEPKAEPATLRRRIR